VLYDGEIRQFGSERGTGFEVTDVIMTYCGHNFIELDIIMQSSSSGTLILILLQRNA
jgi:hypothetical protein